MPLSRGLLGSLLCELRALSSRFLLHLREHHGVLPVPQRHLHVIQRLNVMLRVPGWPLLPAWHDIMGTPQLWSWQLLP